MMEWSEAVLLSGFAHGVRRVGPAQLVRRADDLRRQRVGREYLVGHQTAPIQERYVEHAVVPQPERKGAETVF